MAEIIWTPYAVEDFEDIQEYLGRKFGEHSIRKFTLRVFGFLNILENHPKIGLLEIETKNIRSFVLSKQTTILYKVENEKIYLLSFFDNRQEPGNRLKILDKF